MPNYLTEKEVTEINVEHVEEIKSLMRTFLLKAERRPPVHPPAEGEDSEDDEADPNLRNIQQPQRRARDRVGDMLQLPDGTDRREIPMNEIMKSSDAQHNAVLKKPWYVEEWSNRDRTMAKFILDNVERLIKQVPVRCREFDLLPVQRVAIMAMTNPMPIETFTRCEINADAMKEVTGHRSRKQPFNVKYSIEAGALPTFTIADVRLPTPAPLCIPSSLHTPAHTASASTATACIQYCTGSGKTIMAIMAALSLLCHKERWADLKRGYTEALRSRIRETHSGLCKMESVESGRLARAALIFVPATMLSHWYRTAMSAVFGIKEAFGQAVDVVVWKGLGGREQSLREAHETGKPVLWVLPMEAESMKSVRAHPDIGYVVRIYDELNMPMKTRYEQPESVPLFNYIVRAYALKRAYAPSLC